MKSEHASVGVAEEQVLEQDEVRGQPPEYPSFLLRAASAKAPRQVSFIRNCRSGIPMKTKDILDHSSRRVRNYYCPISFSAQISFKMLC